MAIAECDRPDSCGYSTKRDAWIRKMYDKFITEQSEASTVKEVEMDEMYHYYQKNSKFMDLENYRSRSKNLIWRAFGHRDTKPMIKMYDRMGFENIPHVYADH